MHKIILAIILLGTAFLSNAQEQLEKEITIERDIVPEVHAATRPNIFPSQLQFTITPRRLDAINYGEVSAFGPDIATLEPAATEPAAPITPYRGYVDAGYFPAANVALSAGYAIVSAESTRLNIWAQLNNQQYKREFYPNGDKGKFKHFQGRLGLDFAHNFGRSGKLDITTDFSLATFNQPWSVVNQLIDNSASIHTQTALGWNIGALWQGNASTHLSYHIGAGFNIYNFSKALPIGDYNVAADNGEVIQSVEYSLPGLHQPGFNVNLGIAEKLSSTATVGVDLDASFLHYNRFMQPESLMEFIGQIDTGYSVDESETDNLNIEDKALALPGGKTLGVLTLTPYYRYISGIYSLKVGARIDFTVNSGKKFHVAPAVILGVNPAEGFGASLRLGGGEHLNPLQELAEFSPYICQSMAYGVSNKTFTGDLALRFGPMKGASLTVNLGYVAANNWLMPYTCENNLLFAPTRIRSFKAGAIARWSYRKWLAMEVGFETVIGNEDKNSWIEWRDRARRVLHAGIELKPMKALSVDVAYELRMRRSMPCYGSAMEKFNVNDENVAPSAELVEFNLKNVSNLNIGASYSFTGQFTVFARIENILNTSSYLMPYIPCQGMSGLVGVGYKF